MKIARLKANASKAGVSTVCRWTDNVSTYGEFWSWSSFIIVAVEPRFICVGFKLCAEHNERMIYYLLVIIVYDATSLVNNMLLVAILMLCLWFISIEFIAKLYAMVELRMARNLNSVMTTASIHSDRRMDEYNELAEQKPNEHMQLAIIHQNIARSHMAILHGMSADGLCNIHPVSTRNYLTNIQIFAGLTLCHKVPFECSPLAWKFWTFQRLEKNILYTNVFQTIMSCIIPYNYITHLQYY